MVTVITPQDSSAAAGAILSWHTSHCISSGTKPCHAQAGQALYAPLVDLEGELICQSLVLLQQGKEYPDPRAQPACHIQSLHEWGAQLGYQLCQWFALGYLNIHPHDNPCIQ